CFLSCCLSSDFRRSVLVSISRPETLSLQGCAMDKAALGRSYLEGLEIYWSGRPHTALEHTTLALSRDPHSSDACSLYRLWIEIIAAAGDAEALSSLEEHLRNRSQAESEQRHSYAALRGLIHLELDELPLARLLLPSLEESHENPFVAEFLQRLEMREGNFDSLPLLHLKDDLW